MNDSDAEEFDKFVEKHWGKESVFKIEEYKEQKKETIQKSKRGRKPKLATEN